MATHLLAEDDPAQTVDVPATVAVRGVRCDEWFERWQEAKAARRSRVRIDDRRGGAATTAARDRACRSKWWQPALGDQLPHLLGEEDVVGVLRIMEAAGRAPNTFLGWLVDEGALAVSPPARATGAVDPAFDRVREIEVPDCRFIEMLSARLGTGEDRLVFELLLGTGGRRSEVAGMVVGDVDLAARRVWVRRRPVVEVHGKLIRNPAPKGGRHRAVIVGPALVQMLRRHLQALGPVPPDTPLVSSHRGDGLRWANYLSRTLTPAIAHVAPRWAVGERRRLMAEGLTKAEATGEALVAARRLRRLTPHHLRHTAAALLWAAGASDIEVQLILGHADIDTSKRMCAHLLQGSGGSAAARVEQLREARRTG